MRGIYECQAVNLRLFVNYITNLQRATGGSEKMAGYRKDEAQDWAWESLKGQWSTLCLL